MKKVLFITYYWPPCGGPGVQRALKFVKYLPQFGIMPVVVTVDEKKASYPLLDESLLLDVPPDIKVFRTNTKEPFDLYSKFTKRKSIPHSGFANERNPDLLQRMMRFLRGNLFIPDPRKGWNKFALKKINELLKQESFSAIITSSPPHSTQLAGLQLKKETCLKWIADLRDPWTDIYYYKDMLRMGFARRKDAAYQKMVLENADEILVVSDDIKRMFLAKSGKINPDKIHVIPNGYDHTDFDKISAPPKDTFLITYTGTLAANYGVGNFIKVIGEIIKKNNDTPLRLRFVGEIAGQIKDLIKLSGISNRVEYVKYVPHNESIDYLLHSTTLLLAIPRIENNEGILTGKLFEYLASRKPILCIGPVHGDAAKIITGCEAGIAFDYEEKEKIKQHLLSLINQWKVNPDFDIKNDLHQKFSRVNLAGELSRIIDIL